MDEHFPNVLAYGTEKFVDRNPEIKAAGNLTNFGDKVADCLFISEREPYGYVKRYLKSNIYPIGHSTQLSSRVNDPCIGATLCNGVPTFSSEPVVDLIYPPQISRLEHVRNEIMEEKAYPRRKMANLGRVPRINIAEDVKLCDKACGKVVKSDATVDELLHQPPQMMTFCNCKDHRIKINRHYNEHFKPNLDFGHDQRVHFEDGRVMKNVLYENSAHEKLVSVPLALEDFRQRNSSKLGEVLQPNCDTGVALIDPQFTFGRRKLSAPIDRLLDTRSRDNLRTQELLKHVFERISTGGYDRFDRFLSICSFFDKAQNGKISVEDLKMACRDTEMPLSTSELNNLLDFCDLITPTNTVDYVQFYKIVNPSEPVVPIDTRTFDRQLIESTGKMDISMTSSKLADSKQQQENENSKFPRFDSCPPTDSIEVDDQQRSPVDPLSKKIEQIVDKVNAKSQKSTLSDIDSDITEFDLKKFRTFGLPLLRSERPPPAQSQRLGDLANYGEDSDAYACLYPSIYTQNNVTKRDMLKPRAKNELHRLFCKVYPNLTNEQFDTLYRTAAKRSCDCKVSVEGIKNVLKELNLN